MNINKKLFSIIFNNLSKSENYLNYENELNLNIRTNNNKLIFLGNKITFDINNKYNSQNLNNLNNYYIIFQLYEINIGLIILYNFAI